MWSLSTTREGREDEEEWSASELDLTRKEGTWSVVCPGDSPAGAGETAISVKEERKERAEREAGNLERWGG